MDYIPVYEGEDSDDGSVKLSPGKSSAPASSRSLRRSRIIRSMIHAPGVIQLDERRISVIAMRAESYIQKVENVTVGTPCRQGPAVDGSLQSGGIVGGGRIHLDHQLQDHRGRRALWPGFAAAADESRCSGCGHRDDGEKQAGSDRDRVDIAARRRRPRAQRDRGNARPTGRRPVQDCRSCAGLGRHRRSGARSRCAGGGATRDREGPRFSRPRIHRQNRRHLSRDQQGDTHRAVADRTHQSGSGAAARHVCRCGNRASAARTRC